MSGMDAESLVLGDSVGEGEVKKARTVNAEVSREISKILMVN